MNNLSTIYTILGVLSTGLIVSGLVMGRLRSVARKDVTHAQAQIADLEMTGKIREGLMQAQKDQLEAQQKQIEAQGRTMAEQESKISILEAKVTDLQAIVIKLERALGRQALSSQEQPPAKPRTPRKPKDPTLN